MSTYYDVEMGCTWGSALRPRAIALAVRKAATAIGSSGDRTISWLMARP